MLLQIHADDPQPQTAQVNVQEKSELACLNSSPRFISQYSNVYSGLLSTDQLDTNDRTQPYSAYDVTNKASSSKT